jgi:methyl-accepting chemotaxis protein
MLQRLRPTIGGKIFASIGLAFLGFVGIAALGAWELASGLNDQKRIELRHLTELALGILKEEEAATRSGVAVDEAQRRAAARIATLRYGSDDYFWINDTGPRMVMHPVRPELNVTDLAT